MRNGKVIITKPATRLTRKQKAIKRQKQAEYAIELRYQENLAKWLKQFC